MRFALGLIGFWLLIFIGASPPATAQSNGPPSETAEQSSSTLHNAVSSPSSEEQRASEVAQSLETLRPSKLIQPELKPEELFSDPTVQAVFANAVLEIDQRNAERMERYWAIFSGMVLAATGLAAFFGFGRLRGFVEARTTEFLSDEKFVERVVQITEGKVRSNILDRIERVQADVIFARLLVLADKVRQSDRFSNEERDTLLANARRVSNQAPDFRDSDEFISVIELIIDSFFGAGLWAQLNEMNAEFGDLIKRHRGCSLTMIQAYATQVLGGDIEDQARIDAFLGYVEAVKALKYPEAGINYALVYYSAYRPANWQRKIDVLLTEYEHLEPGDRERAIASFGVNLDPWSLSKSPKGMHFTMVRRFSEFLESYRARLSAIDPRFASMQSQVSPPDQRVPA